MCCHRKPFASNVLAIVFLVLMFSVPSGHVRAQEKASDLDRERRRTMSKRIKGGSKGKLLRLQFRGVEHRDVTPDDIRLPTAEDLAAGRDTVLSYAASLVGVKVDPVEAGKLFPIVRPKK